MSTTVSISMTISMNFATRHSHTPVAFPTSGLPGVTMTRPCPPARSVNLLRTRFYPMAANPYILAIAPFPIFIYPNVFCLRRCRTNNNLPLRANGYKYLR